MASAKTIWGKMSVGPPKKYAVLECDEHFIVVRVLAESEKDGSGHEATIRLWKPIAVFHTLQRADLFVRDLYDGLGIL